MATTAARTVLLASLVALPATAALAQSPPVVTETVQVVATRLPETPHEVPASVEVFTGDDLRALGATSLKDALALATGVAIAPGGDGGPAGAVPEFWGLREFDAFLLVVDDVPWGGAFNPALTSLSMRDVARVEVLRGPAPVTFGATSFVGVIHVVHQAAAVSRSYASASGGSYGSGAAAIDVAIPSSGAWRSRLSVDGERQGFKDDRTSFARGHALWRTARSVNDRRLWFLADVNVLRQQPASPHPRQGRTLTALVPSTPTTTRPTRRSTRTA
ncbi:MAG: TonB-dependent receptor plug domain-containing protein [Vicinamibacterales bacterium]